MCLDDHSPATSASWFDADKDDEQCVTAPNLPPTCEQARARRPRDKASRVRLLPCMAADFARFTIRNERAVFSPLADVHVHESPC